MDADVNNERQTAGKGGKLALGRREFLKVTSTSVVAIALSSPSAALAAGGKLAAIELNKKPRAGTLAARVSVGHWSGEYGDTFVDAASIASGDGSLSDRAVRVEVVGRQLAALDGSQSLARFTVDVGTELYPNNPIRLGHYEFRGFENASAPAAIGLALDKGSGLTVDVGLAAGAGNATQSVRFSLTPGSATGRVKLVPGFYAIAVTADRASAAPDWSQYQAWSAPGVEGLALVNGAGEVAPFTYLLFSVDG